MSQMLCETCPAPFCDGDCVRWNKQPTNYGFTSQYLEDADSAGYPGTPDPHRLEMNDATPKPQQQQTRL